MPSRKSPTTVRTGHGARQVAVTSGSAANRAPAFLPEGDYGDILVGDRGAQISIQDGVVTNARLASMSANSVKARSSATDGSPSDVVVGENTVLGRLSGNIVAVKLVGSQVEDDAIANSKMANMPPHTVKVNNGLSDADPVDLLMGENTVLARVDNTALAPLEVQSNSVVGRGGSGLSSIAVTPFSLLGRKDAGGMASIDMAANTVLARASGDVAALVVGANAVLARAGGDLGPVGVEANTVLARAGGNLEALPVGTNTVLGRAAGNLVAGQLITDQVTNGAVTNAKLATMPSATMKGRRRRDVTGAPRDLTRAEVGEIVASTSLATPAWFDDMYLISDTPEFATGAGNWILRENPGSISISVVNEPGRPGIIRFRQTNTSVSMQLQKTGYAETGNFMLGSFQRLVCGIRRTIGFRVGLIGAKNVVFEVGQGTANYVVHGWGNGGVNTGVSCPSDTFADLVIERLSDHTLEFSVNGVVVQTLPMVTGDDLFDEMFVQVAWFSGPENAYLDLDYLGCSWATPFRG